MHDACHDFLRSERDGEMHGFGFVGFFEHFQLVGEHFRAHEMAGAGGEARSQSLGIAVEENRGEILAENFSVSSLQCGAGENRHGIRQGGADYFVAQPLQPGQAVRVIERDSPAHLIDILGRVEVVRVKKNAPKP